MKKINVAVESLLVDKETEQPEWVVRFQLWIKSTDVEAFRAADFSCVGYQPDYRLFDGDGAQGNFDVVETRDQLSLIDGWFDYFGNSCAVFYNLTGIQLDWRCVGI